MNELLFSTDVQKLSDLTKQQMLELLLAQANILKQKKAKQRMKQSSFRKSMESSETVESTEVPSSPRRHAKKDSFDFNR